MILKVLYRQMILNLKEAGIKTAQLDARVLICAVLDVSLEKFYLLQSNQLSPSQIKKIKAMIKKRALNMPVAYILGHKEFYGLDFKIDKNVLIPRPETEYLVELAFDRIKYYESSIKDKNSLIHASKYMILDMGTGCGNIIIAISKSLPSLRGRRGDRSNLFFASDVSSDALKIARQNAKLYKVESKIKFIQSDLFSKFKNQKFDLIIANLPYVPISDCHSGLACPELVEWDPESRSPMSDSPSMSFRRKPESSIYFEPQSAIFANDNGTDIIKRFLKDAPNYLSDNGTILLELDPRNAIDIKNHAQKYFPKSKIKLSKDLAGFNRYLTISLG